MSFKLYKINASIDLALQLAIDGEMSDEDLRDNLAAIELEFDEKADAIACGIKNFLAEAEAIKAEADKLTERRKKAEATAERMKAYLSAQMQQAGKLALKTPRTAISHRESDQTIIDNLSMLPEAFVRRKPAPAPEADKTAIKAAIKAGTAVPGAHIEKFQNIQIK
jgi:paraquat-inducible protein B